MFLYCQTDTEIGTIPTGPGNGYLSYTRPINLLGKQDRNKTDGALPLSYPLSRLLCALLPPRSRWNPGYPIPFSLKSSQRPLSDYQGIPIPLDAPCVMCDPLDAMRACTRLIFPRRPMGARVAF